MTQRAKSGDRERAVTLSIALAAMVVCVALVACSPFSGADPSAEDGGADAVTQADGDGSSDSGVPANPDTGSPENDAEVVDATASFDAALCDGGFTHQFVVSSSKYSWTDCVPIGTYNQAQAKKACAAMGATGCAVDTALQALCGHPDGGFLSGQAASTISSGTTTWGWAWTVAAGGGLGWQMSAGVCYTSGSWN